MPASTTPDADYLELNRCLHSLIGHLDAICDDMENGPNGFVLRAIIEGGMPEIVHIGERLASKAGVPIERAVTDKSYKRGYQTTVLARREEAGEDVPRDAWAESPDEFWKREVEARTDGLCRPPQHYFGSGDRCQCGAHPTATEAPHE